MVRRSQGSSVGRSDHRWQAITQAFIGPGAARDAKKAGDLIEHGFLQFAVTLDVPAEAYPVIRKRLAELEKVPSEQITVSILPVKAATVVL